MATSRSRASGRTPLGIYTPMEIVVTCAAGGMDGAPVDNADDFKLALERGVPLFVQLEG